MPLNASPNRKNLAGLMMTLAEPYRDAIRLALAVQASIAVLLLALLDGGHMARVGGCVLLGFWVGTAIILYRRPLQPRPSDLWFIRYGYLPPLLVGVVLVSAEQLSRWR